MNANELMIGDWVKIGNIIAQITQLKKVNNEQQFFSVYYYHTEDKAEEGCCIDEIQPIPLTAEILEKNGFRKEVDKNNFESYLYYNFAGDGFIRVILWDGGDGDWSIKIGNYDKFDDNEIIYKNDFVFLKLHQLQHALRLCGVDKEIVL